MTDKDDYGKMTEQEKSEAYARARQDMIDRQPTAEPTAEPASDK